MDFGRPHRAQAGVAYASNIRLIDISSITVNKSDSLDEMLITSANDAAMRLFGTHHLRQTKDMGGKDNHTNEEQQLKLVKAYTDSRSYPERIVERSDCISEGSLVVIFECFDSVTFVYATPKAIFHNRNGMFYHDDFIGKPFGCKIYSRSTGGAGFVFLLRPTAELWCRSLPHRTQIVHELDASMIVFHLNLRPGMIVCESGTGSGSMSHFILRTIAPSGVLHTYEFNKNRADKAREEFRRNKVDRMVIVHDRDVCGKQPPSSSNCVISDNNTEDNNNIRDVKGPSNASIAATSQCTAAGFGIGGQVADAIFLDLPEPWLAVPHAAYTIKPDGRLCSYSPCVEQTQRCVTALRECGFHSIKTIEARLREFYVDDVELESPPKGRIPRVGVTEVIDGAVAVEAALTTSTTTTADEDNSSAKEPSESESAQSISSKKHTRFPDSEDTGAEADNERSEAEDMLVQSALERSGGPSSNSSCPATASTVTEKITTRRKKLCVRPFPVMRGHTAFLTFATAGRKARPNPLLE